MQEADDVPKLCHTIEEHLSDQRKRPLGCFLTSEEFEKWVAEEVGLALTEDEKKVAVEYVDSSGIVIILIIFN